MNDATATQDVTVENVTVIKGTVGSVTDNDATVRTATIDTVAIDYWQGISVNSGSVAIGSALVCPGQPLVV